MTHQETIELMQDLGEQLSEVFAGSHFALLSIQPETYKANLVSDLSREDVVKALRGLLAKLEADCQIPPVTIQ